MSGIAKTMSSRCAFSINSKRSHLPLAFIENSSLFLLFYWQTSMLRASGFDSPLCRVSRRGELFFVVVAS